MKWLLALALLLLPPSLAQAQSGGAQCAGLASDAERLACYEGLFASQSEAAAENTLNVSSENLIPAYPSGRERATLTIACENEAPVVRFHFAGHVLSPTASRTGISLQRDLQADQILSLPPSPDGQSLLIVGVEATNFLNSLRGVTMLTARVTPFSYRLLSVRFRVAGLDAEAAPVLAPCT